MRYKAVMMIVGLMAFSMTLFAQYSQPPASAVKAKNVTAQEAPNGQVDRKRGTTSVTKKSSKVTDIDGNVYRTVTIGTQVWMAENLKVTHYRNGIAIPNVIDSTVWKGLSTGAYCEYNNDVSNVAPYGRLYNWYAVADVRNIAPAGWHVPSEADWQTLDECLGDRAVAGGKMKEAGTSHWASPNTGATNRSGFSGLPGCNRGDTGVYFNTAGKYVYYWSSTELSSYDAWSRILSSSHPEVSRYYLNKRYGFSVRCVKD